MNAGKLRHRITHQTLSETTDPRSGQRLQSWTDVASYWAEVRPLSGRELVNAQQIRTDVSHSITLRADVGSIMTKDRFVFGSRHFNLVQVIDLEERGIEVAIMATEVM